VVLEEAFGLRVSRGGLCQGLSRMARKAAPTYAAMIQHLRGSPSVTPDETGGKVGIEHDFTPRDGPQYRYLDW